MWSPNGPRQRRHWRQLGRTDADPETLSAATLRYREAAAMVGRLEELGEVSRDATPWRHRLLAIMLNAVRNRGKALQRLAGGRGGR